MTNVRLTDTQDVKVTVTGETDKKGNPVPLTGSVTFTSADPNIVLVKPDPDGDPNSAILSAVGPLSTATIVSVSNGTVTDNIAVEIEVSAAVGFAVAVGTPTEQP